MTFEVKLQQFEGPLDLLLSLISRHEVDIYEISISQITDEYLAYIESLKELNLEVASEFLLIAATLLEIKSKGLLPSEEEIQTEPLAAAEVKKELIKKLINYKKYKNVAEFFEQKLNLGSRYYRREAELEECFAKLMPDFDEEITPQDLAKHLLHIVRVRHYSIVSTSHITPMSMSVDEQIDYVLSKLKDRPQKFKDITKNFNKNEVIVTFLAILELYKRSMVDIVQGSNFGQIELEFLEGVEDA